MMLLTSSLIDKIAELYYTNFWREKGYKAWAQIENQATYRTTVAQVLTALNEIEKK